MILSHRRDTILKKLSLLTTILIILIVTTACNSGVKFNMATSKEDISFANTEWGMTKSEVVKKLGVKEDAMILMESESMTHDNYLLENFKYDENLCDLTATFSNELTTATKEGVLIKISAAFKTVEPAKQEVERLSKILEVTKNQIVSDDGLSKGESYTYLSTDTVNSYFDDEKKSDEYFEAFLSDLDKFHKEDEVDGEYLIKPTDKQHLDGYKLSTASVIIFPEIPAGGKYIAYIDYNGAGKASVETYNK